VTRFLLTLSMADVNPLIQGIVHVQDLVSRYRDHARAFYCEILCAAHPCPTCGAKMQMASAYEWRCGCGVTLDPTVEFQRSLCCQARVQRRRCHYVCSRCGAPAVSTFLFDERLFDARYFSEKMSESRQRRIRRKEALRRFLAASRSKDLIVLEFPDNAVIDSVFQAIDGLVEARQGDDMADYSGSDAFRMEAYREILLASLQGRSVRFDALPQVCADPRLDRARRLMTLLFMEQSRQVWLEQRNQEIMVIPYETHSEG